MQCVFVRFDVAVAVVVIRKEKAKEMSEEQSEMRRNY
jgi:hypothetical protein